MVHLILGRAGTGKTARIFDEISESVRQCRGGIVLLVPEQYSHEAERELCRAAGDTLSLYGEVLSFTGLARKVFSQCGGARPVMDGGGRLLCMASAVDAVADRLKVYARCRREPNMLESLLRAAEELKNADITADRLADAASSAPGMLGEKLRDMSLLTEAYSAAKGRSAADPADVLETLASLIGDSLAVSGRFYVDGFTDFTALEKKVLRELICSGAEITVCLTCERDESLAVFSLPAATARWLRRMAEDCGAGWDEIWIDRETEQSALAYYADHLFDFSPGIPPEDASGIELVSAGDMIQECELAAARMSELARGGARWRDMAVAVRGFSDYRSALEGACARYRVPLFMSGRDSLLRRSVPVFMMSALEAVLRGYEYEPVFRLLKTGFMPVGTEECDRIENYVILWGIRGAAWDRPWTMHPEGYNRAFGDDTRAQLESLNDVRQRVIAPLRRLEYAVKSANTAKTQAAAMADFLVEVDLPGRLEVRAGELESKNRPEEAAEYGRLWEVVCGALEQFASVLGDMAMDGEQFRAMFSLMLGKYDLGVIPVSLDRVQAGDFNGMRRRHTKHLFVLGATDGRLPAPEEGSGVFTPEERDELCALGFAMGGAEEEMARELGLIYNCLSLPSETLYISWPLTDSDGGEARPSMIAERARAMFALKVRQGDILRARTFSAEAAFSLAIRGQSGDENPLCRGERQVFADMGREEELSRLVNAARADRGRLAESSVRALYGNPTLSATRAEKFSDCRFGYFLQYGLKAKPRQQAVFDPRDYGTFMHYVLEKTAGDAMAMGGFECVTAEDIRRITDKYMELYIREEMNDFADKTPRFEYLFRRLRRTVHRVTEDMWQELKVSRFRPLDIELDLNAPGVLAPAEGEETKLNGRADRVDGWVHDGVLYLRVTDYKTGVKKFSLSDVCQGVNMQMLLYLFTLQKRAGDYYGAKEIRPAGVLYSPARYDIVRMDAEPEADAEMFRSSSVKRSGLILSDPAVIEAMEPGETKKYLPIRILKSGDYSKDSEGHIATLERFGALSRYIDKTLGELAAQLRAGSVTADPWFKNARDNACVWCDYREACLFDEAKDCRRVRENLKPSDAWERIEHE